MRSFVANCLLTCYALAVAIAAPAQPSRPDTLAAEKLAAVVDWLEHDVETGRVQHGPAEEAIGTYHVEERSGRMWLRIPAQPLVPVA